MSAPTPDQLAVLKLVEQELRRRVDSYDYEKWARPATEYRPIIDGILGTWFELSEEMRKHPERFLGGAT